MVPGILSRCQAAPGNVLIWRRAAHLLAAQVGRARPDRLPKPAPQAVPFYLLLRTMRRPLLQPCGATCARVGLRVAASHHPRRLLLALSRAVCFAAPSRCPLCAPPPVWPADVAAGGQDGREASTRRTFTIGTAKHVTSAFPTPCTAVPTPTAACQEWRQGADRCVFSD
jgi:hypothetical protein